MSNNSKAIKNPEAKLPCPLYHGTSTLFLDSIVSHGLGGVNPIVEWKLVDLAKEVFALSEEYLKKTELFQISSYSFKKMAEQSNGGSFNFQHGDTYLSPSKQTAARYAIGKRYGSEMLTYTINFLTELLRMDIDYVKLDLRKKYKKIFGLIGANPSPLLIMVNTIDKTSLLNEYGEDPSDNFAEMSEVLEDNLDPNLCLQQTNFRLSVPIQANELRFWLINVQKLHSLTPKYNLYEVKIDSRQEKST